MYVCLQPANQTLAECTGAPQSPTSVSSHDAANETPSSSTQTATSATLPVGQMSEDIANGYRYAAILLT